MLDPGAFEDRRTLLVRLTVLRIGIVVSLALLAVGFWILQVLSYSKYREMAENNQLRTIPVRAPRGVLFDRNLKVLVENRYSFTISIVREQSANPRNVSDAVKRLAAATGADEARLADIMRRHRTDASFQPIPVIEHATIEQVYAVMARRLELPEVVVQRVPTRHYPEGGLAAHLFGYVSEIQESQLERIEYAGLPSGAMVGQSGVERTYNSQLMGQDGARYVAVNSKGRELEERGTEDAVDGERLQLTIDLDLQHALEDAYRANNFAGAAVLLDPRNGEVLALMSQPEFNPNDFANGVDHAEWAKLSSDPLKPLRDKLVQDRYSPGSTFKIVVATAALAEGVITPETTFTCTGSAVFYGRSYQCDKHEAHGTLNLRQAIEKSCDVYFYNVANLLTIDQIHKYAEKLGLVGKTGIDLPNEIESIIPSNEWKLKVTGEKWYPGDTISAGIGQGYVTVTPIALATMMATVANGGTVITPHVVKAVDQGSGWQSLNPPAPRSVFPIPPEIMNPIRDGLWLVVNGEGTGSRAQIAGHDVVGKTGTAQVISMEGAKAARAAGKSAADVRDHGWFVFFAPKDNPTIAGVVFAEHAGYGGSTVAPIARYALETYFAKKEGRPLPAIRMDPGGTMDVITGAAADAFRAAKAPATSGTVVTPVAGPAVSTPIVTNAPIKKSGG